MRDFSFAHVVRLYSAAPFCNEHLLSCCLRVVVDLLQWRQTCTSSRHHPALAGVCFVLMALVNFATSGGDATGSSHSLLGEADMEAFSSLPFKERVDKAGELTALAGLYPSSAYRYHLGRLFLYISSGLCLVLARWPSAVTGCHNVPHGFAHECASATERNGHLHSAFVRFTALTALSEICGFSGMTGPLGAGQATWAPLWYRLTKGTLKQPFISCLPRRRGCIDMFLFITYSANMVYAVTMIDDLRACARSLRMAVVLLTGLCLMDRTAYNGSLGAYYYPLLVCQAFGGDHDIIGCQLVQCAHLLMAGVGKLGPWFRHVTPSMVGICPWVPRVCKKSLFQTRADGNSDLLRPSVFSDLLSFVGVLVEIFAAGLMISTIDALRFFGVFSAVVLHVYVVLMLAPGAVGEWNVYNAVATVYLFGFHTGVSMEKLKAAPVPMLIFVFTTVYGGPLLGNLWPNCLSNHFTLRKYTGNHPYHTFLLRRSAVPKLNCIRTYQPLVAAAPHPQADLIACGALHSLIRGRLNLRRLLDLFSLAISDKPQASHMDDFLRVDLGFFFSQTMLDVTFLDASLLELLKNTGIEPGELYSLRVSSFPTFTFWPHRSQWEACDVGAGQTVAAGFVLSDETLDITYRAGTSR